MGAGSNLVPLARLLVAASGRDAWRRAAPFYMALAIAAFVLFAGSGLDAATITRAAERSRVLRLSLLVAWVVASLPGTRALLYDPRAQFLKALPVRERDVLTVLGALLVVAEGPWLILWSRGAGGLAGLSAGLLALSTRTMWVAGPWRWPRWALVMVLLSAWSWAPPVATVAAGALLFPVAVRWAWQQSPEEGAMSGSGWVRGPALVALGAAYVATVLRAHAATVARGLLITFGSASFACLLIRNGDLRDTTIVAARLEALFVAPAVLSLVVLAGPMLRTERGAAWILDAATVSPRRRRLALTLALAAFSSSLAVVYGLTAIFALHLEPYAAGWILGELLILALALPALADGLVRFAVRDRGRDAARLIVGAGGLMVAVVVSVVAAPRIALSACVAAALGHLMLGRRTDRVFATASHGRPAPQRKEPYTMLKLSGLRKSLGAREVVAGVDLTVAGGDVAGFAERTGRVNRHCSGW